MVWPLGKDEKDPVSQSNVWGRPAKTCDSAVVENFSELKTNRNEGK